MHQEPFDIQELQRQTECGEELLFSQLLALHRPRLRRIVAMRLDRRLGGRIDPSDVIQDAYLEASQRLPDYLRRPAMPFFIWLRFITLQRVALAHRKHLGTQARNAGREISIDEPLAQGSASAVLATRLIDNLSGPSAAAQRAERLARLQTALEQLRQIDLEVLVLRHFEELTHTEIAQLLGIRRAGASHRYQRALKRLRGILESMPGGIEGVES